MDSIDVLKVYTVPHTKILRFLIDRVFENHVCSVSWIYSFFPFFFQNLFFCELSVVVACVVLSKFVVWNLFC